jgi:hypothetical protein
MSSLNIFAKAERYLQKALGRLPSWLSRFFGYRHEEAPQSPTWMICLWGFIGAFGVVGSLFAVFGHTHYFTSRLVPPILVSFVRHETMLVSLTHKAAGCFSRTLFQRRSLFPCPAPGPYLRSLIQRLDRHHHRNHLWIQSPQE